MIKRTERAIDALMAQAKEVAKQFMSREDAAEFFSELADRAYAQHEALMIEDDCEMQDYENDNQ